MVGILGILLLFGYSRMIEGQAAATTDKEICAEPFSPFYEPVCGSDNLTYTNTQVLACQNYHLSQNVTVVSEGQCKSVDYCSGNGFDISGSNPVCCNNGLTYQNAAQVKCLQQYNPSLKILHDGGCTVPYVYQTYRNRKSICQIACTRYEWNPVCASDGKTYTNPFIFLCTCPQLDIVYNGKCNTATHRACERAHKDDKFVNGVFVNDKYTSNGTVCGIDGRNYQSDDHLRCKSRYNKYLYKRHDGACNESEDDPCRWLSVEESQEGNPVCGSDGRTYISPQGLWCQKHRTNSKLTYVHDGPCS